MPLLQVPMERSAVTSFSYGTHTHHYSLPYGPKGYGGAPGPDHNKNTVTNGYDYPPPFSRFVEFSNVNRFPLRTIGVLFFTQNGSSYRCSGAVAYRNIVWTAGHCVHDGSGSESGWSTNFVFYPSWRAGAENPKFGHYDNWSNSWVTTNWYDDGNLEEDFGVVVFDDTGAGYPGDDLGWLGFETGATPVQQWAVIGFPAESPFNGKAMTTCQTSYSIMDTSRIVGFGCDMTGGSSGGPGIRKINGKGGYINTNMSFGYIGYKWESFGPYFGDHAWSLFCTAIEYDGSVDHPDC